MNAARLKEVERVQEALKIREGQGQEEQVTRGKRKAEGEFELNQADMKKRRGGDSPPPESSEFPADFFSNSSHTPILFASDEAEGEGDYSNKAPATSPSSSALDLEWQRFQRDVLNAPDHRDAYERATVFAQPELVSETPEGFPAGQIDHTVTELPNKIDENEAMKRKEQEERELIIDRLLDEERAQEEADMKVSVMKNRVDALKKRRDAARVSKP
jgi:zinc finger protein 830